MFDDNTNKQMSILVFKVLLPINIFMSIYKSDFRRAFNIKYVLFLLISTFIGAIIMALIAKRLTNDPKKLGIMIQDGVRGNHSIFGLPLALAIYGEKVGVYMAIAISFITPLLNIYGLSIFEHYENIKSSFISRLLKVIKTPIVIFSVLGVVFNLANIVLPDEIYNTLNYISISLTAISLINLGSGFNLKLDKRILKYLLAIIVFKLIVLPAFTVTGAALLGFRNEELVAIFVMSSVPLAVSSYATAAIYDVDLDLANSAVVYSHIICAVTIPLILSIIISLGLI